jgi:hypothetical protein
MFSPMNMFEEKKDQPRSVVVILFVNLLDKIIFLQKQFQWMDKDIYCLIYLLAISSFQKITNSI